MANWLLAQESGKGCLRAVVADVRICKNICTLDHVICCRTYRAEIIWGSSPFQNLICSNNCFWERISLRSSVAFFFFLNGKENSLYMKVLFWEKQAMLPVMFPGKTCDLFFEWIMDYLVIDSSLHRKWTVWLLHLTLHSFAFVYRDHIYTVDMDTSHTEEIYFSKVSSFYHHPETKDTRTNFK